MIMIKYLCTNKANWAKHKRKIEKQKYHGPLLPVGTVRLYKLPQIVGVQLDGKTIKL